MLQRQEWKSALIEASVGGNSDPDQAVIKDLLKVGKYAPAVILERAEAELVGCDLGFKAGVG
jgi:hypothetical protein